MMGPKKFCVKKKCLSKKILGLKKFLFKKNVHLVELIYPNDLLNDTFDQSELLILSRTASRPEYTMYGGRSHDLKNHPLPLKYQLK